MNDVSSILKKLREEKEYSQKHVADILGISQQAYSNYETERREIPVRHIRKLSELYGVSTDYLLGTDTQHSYVDKLDSLFTQDQTLKDVLYNLQSLHEHNRETALQYILFLKKEQKRKK